MQKLRQPKHSPVFRDLTGKRFKRWLVLNYAGATNCRESVYNCLCNCGTKRQVKSNSLVSGKSTSCGCYDLEFRTKHGQSYSLIYKVYRGMIQRCYNPNSPNYSNYGGRGIKMCKRWLGKMGFIHFFSDMSPTYKKGLSIERERVNGDYKPSNCKWATPSEQGKNRRVSIRSIDIKKHKTMAKKLLSALNHAIRDGCNSQYFKYIGCSKDEFLLHMQSQFKNGMSWNNYGKHYVVGPKRWNIDHIKPIYKFDLAIEKQVYKCFNIKNLRPRWGKDNMTYTNGVK